MLDTPPSELTGCTNVLRFLKKTGLVAIGTTGTTGSATALGEVEGDTDKLGLGDGLLVVSEGEAETEGETETEGEIDGDTDVATDGLTEGEIEAEGERLGDADGL